MEQLAIFSATLGLSPPWQVISVAFAKETNRMDICVEYLQGNQLTCPVCGTQGPTCHAESQTEVWYHDDFFSYATYLHALVPHLACCGRSVPLERPWCRAGSKFARVT
jgi:hypothetical protein